MTRISENELILPTLHLLFLKDSLSTTQLINCLRKLLMPSGEDLVLLKGRKDDKFSQKVRNLYSHKTLIGPGLVKYNGIKRNVRCSLTDKGRELYFINQPNLFEIFSFPLEKTREILHAMYTYQNVEVVPERSFIFEGWEEGRGVIQKKMIRSKKLRNAAIEHYTKNGHIQCLACLFEFNNNYKNNIGKNYIEIHHNIPIYTYNGRKKLSLEKALKNVSPLCANCHRVVHLHKPILTVDFVKDSVIHGNQRS